MPLLSPPPFPLKSSVLLAQALLLLKHGMALQARHSSNSISPSYLTIFPFCRLEHKKKRKKKALWVALKLGVIEKHLPMLNSIL